MALIKDSSDSIDMKELASAIAKRQEERRGKALELKIAERADFIARVLGNEFCLDNYSIPSFFPSEYKVYQKGSVYRGNALMIESTVIPREADEGGGR
jgi:hypothetical protein